MPFADKRQDPRQNRPVQRAVLRFIGFQKLRPVVRAVDRLGQEEIRPVEHLAVQGPDLALRVRRAQVERRAHEEIGRLADAGPRMVHAGVEAALDELDQPGGHQVVVVHRFGVIADRGRVAHHHEHVADPQRVGRQQVALDAQQVATAGGEMQGHVHAHLALDHVTHRPGRHPHARHGTVGHVDHIRSGFGKHGCPGNDFVRRQAARRVHFNGNDKFSSLKFLRQQRGL